MQASTSINGDNPKLGKPEALEVVGLHLSNPPQGKSIFCHYRAGALGAQQRLQVAHSRAGSGDFSWAGNI